MIPEQIYRAWLREALRRRERVTVDAAYRSLMAQRWLETRRERLRMP